MEEQKEVASETLGEVKIKVAKSPDLNLIPTPRTPELIKKLKIKHPIIYAIVVIISFAVGVALSTSITKIVDLFTYKEPDAET